MIKIKAHIIRVKLLVFLTGLNLFSCEKVIDVDVSDTDTKIVIEAIYDATSERVDVNISKSKNVFGANVFPSVKGAIIQIKNDSGESKMLNEIGDGKYELTDYSPVYSSKYTMTVLVEEQEYIAENFLPPVVPLDSLTQEFQEASLFGDEGYIVYMNFTDPGGENYYRAMRKVNGDPLESLGEQFIFDNAFSAGNSQTVPFFSTRHEVNDTIEVDLRSYSKKSYDYYSELFDIVGDSGQSAAPANPISNWSNGALGHFGTWGFDRKVIVIGE